LFFIVHRRRAQTAATTAVRSTNKKGEILSNLSLLRNVIEELFLLLDGFLDGFLGRGFLLSCHGESPPLQIARVAQNLVNKNISLT
jgi:hypothetical protein